MDGSPALEFELAFSRIVYLDHANTAAYAARRSDLSLEHGDLVVCPSDANSILLFGWNLLGSFFFIEVSDRSYRSQRDHGSGLPALFEPRGQLLGLSMYEYFRTCVGDNRMPPQPYKPFKAEHEQLRDALPDGVHYVYLTREEKQHVSKQAAGPCALLLQRDLLQLFYKEEALAMFASWEEKVDSELDQQQPPSSNANRPSSSSPAGDIERAGRRAGLAPHGNNVDVAVTNRSSVKRKHGTK